MKDYYKSVEFPELDKPVESKIIEAPTVTISRNNLDNIKDEILKMIRAVESGQSDICGAKLISKNAPTWKALDNFFNCPSPNGFVTLFNVLENEFNRRFRLEAMNIALNFKDVQEFVTIHKIGVL